MKAPRTFEEWADRSPYTATHNGMGYFRLPGPIKDALRAAFAAGRESMREEAASTVDEHPSGACAECAAIIRAIPTNPEEGGA